ncbi:MAG: hypothetical protein BAJATHORv1_30035 [Candidatus Thorarchaeota archaeon]|nr:MAG: hypothetical protein BAJATHORv1_30035 [Candidatus Thorarchaeota archaeon]
MEFPSLKERGLDIHAFTCAQCSFCQVGHGACPTYKVKRVDSYSGKGKMLITRALAQKRISKEEGLEGLRDGIFGCTLCGGCEEVCQVDIPFIQIYQLMRSDFKDMGMWPEGLGDAKAMLMKSRNIQGQPQMDRIEGWSYWHPEEDYLLDREGVKSKTAIFLGCASSFKAVPIQASIATAMIMEKIDEEFTMLGEEEWCCGAPLIMTGDFEGAKEFALHNIRKYKELGVERIVTNCPGCYKMWAHEYHEFLDIDHEFEIIYGADFFMRLIDEGKMNNISSDYEATVTFHDGCDAGRNAGFYEEPRKVLENLPGVTFEELPHNKANCYCCGSGGVLRAFDNEFALQINELKVEDIEQTNTDIVVSMCPSCVDFMHGQLPVAGSEKASMDLAVIIAKSLGLEWEGLDEVY